MPPPQLGVGSVSLSQGLLPGRPWLQAQRGRLRRALAAGSGRATTAAGLVGLVAAGSGPMLSGAGAPQLARRPSDFGHPARRATDVLLVTNAVLFGLQLLTKESLTVWGVKINQLIIRGQYWRLLTPAFLHGNLIHLAVNSLSLHNLGPLVEASSGHKRLLLMYLTAAVAGNVASFVGSTAPSLGASGAVFGLGGALGVYFYRNKNIFGRRSDQALSQLWQTLLMNVVYGLMNPRIDNWGHMGGMLGGALAAYLLGPALQIKQLPGRRGQFLVDDAPLPWLRSPPRQIK